jgi:hypothetical protein
MKKLKVLLVLEQRTSAEVKINPVSITLLNPDFLIANLKKIVSI